MRHPARMDPSVPPPAPTESNAGAKFLVDYGPILVFVLLYNFLRRDDPDGAIYTAATVFAVVATLALAWSRLKLGKFSGVLVFTTVLIIVTVGLAYIFRDPRFIYMKPTVVNAAYGVLAIGGALLNKNLIKMLIGDAYEMADKAWNTLAIRWGLFFFFCAGLNEFIWRNFSEAFWANFKLLGFIPITLIFAASQIPFLMRHGAIELPEKDNS